VTVFCSQEEATMTTTTTTERTEAEVLAHIEDLAAALVATDPTLTQARAFVEVVDRQRPDLWTELGRARAAASVPPADSVEAIGGRIADLVWRLEARKLQLEDPALTTVQAKAKALETVPCLHRLVSGR
jgi:hypothetical protein